MSWSAVQFLGRSYRVPRYAHVIQPHYDGINAMLLQTSSLLFGKGRWIWRWSTSDLMHRLHCMINPPRSRHNLCVSLWQPILYLEHNLAQCVSVCQVFDNQMPVVASLFPSLLHESSLPPWPMTFFWCILSCTKMQLYYSARSLFDVELCNIP